MKPQETIWFYYLRGKLSKGQEKHPLVTVCVMQGPLRTFPSVVVSSRGLSVCSDSEPTLNKKRGRRQALAFARQAFYTLKSSCCIERDEAHRVMARIEDDLDSEFLVKSCWKPEFTEFEKRLLNL